MSSARDGDATALAALAGQQLRPDAGPICCWPSGQFQAQRAGRRSARRRLPRAAPRRLHHGSRPVAGTGQPSPRCAAEQLRAALFFSAETARHFVQLVQRARAGGQRAHRRRDLYRSAGRRGIRTPALAPHPRRRPPQPGRDARAAAMTEPEPKPEAEPPRPRPQPPPERAPAARGRRRCSGDGPSLLAWLCAAGFVVLAGGIALVWWHPRPIPTPQTAADPGPEGTSAGAGHPRHATGAWPAGRALDLGPLTARVRGTGEAARAAAGTRSGAAGKAHFGAGAEDAGRATARRAGGRVVGPGGCAGRTQQRRRHATGAAAERRRGPARDAGARYGADSGTGPADGAPGPHRGGGGGAERRADAGRHPGRATGGGTLRHRGAADRGRAAPRLPEGGERGIGGGATRHRGQAVPVAGALRAPQAW